MAYQSSILSDHDCNFKSHFWRAILQNLGTLVSLSTTNRLEMDGQIEQVNQLLKDMLHAYI